MPTTESPTAPQRWPWIVILRREDRVAATGEYCPTSGAWSAPAWPSAAVVVLRGEVMPSLCGEAVEWHYTAELNPLSALDLDSSRGKAAPTPRGMRVVAGNGTSNGKEPGREIEIPFLPEEH